MRYLIFIFLTSFPPAHLCLANVVGSDFQNFNPTSNGLDFITVQSAKTLEPGIVNFGLFANYAINPLPEFEDQNLERSGLRNSLTSLDLNMGLGLTKYLDVGMSLPFTLSQSIKKDNERYQYANNGLNEFRINAKVRLNSPRASFGLALITSISQNTIADNPYTGKDPKPTLFLECALDKHWSWLSVALNLGYRKRTPGRQIEDAPVAPYHDQYITSLGLSHYWSGIDSLLILEFFGSLPAADEDSTDAYRSQHSAESILGIKHLISHNLAFHSGAGTYLNKNTASPDYRIYAGINWTLGPIGKQSEITVKRKSAKKNNAIVEQTVLFSADDEIEIEITPPREETFVLKNIEFAYASDSIIVGDSLTNLDKIGRALVKRSFTHIKVVGHTDSIGTRDHNQSLSEKRAAIVREYLIKKFSIPQDKISSQGKGEDLPIAENSTYQGRQRNRRVELNVTFQ